MNSAPGPPSSQSLSLAKKHVSVHAPPVCGCGGGGEGEGGGGEGEGDGGTERGPQSVQSVPYTQFMNSAPGPPSSQSLSLAKKHVSVHAPPVCGCGGGGEGEGGGGEGEGGGGEGEGGGGEGEGGGGEGE